MITKVANDRQGIQSVEVGLSLLRVIAANNRPMMLRDIAKEPIIITDFRHEKNRFANLSAMRYGNGKMKNKEPIPMLTPAAETLCRHLKLAPEPPKNPGRTPACGTGIS